MTEPVAWRYTDCGYYRVTKEKPNPAWDYKDITPLYTSEQLYPRVKMTQAEFDEWSELYQSNILFSSVMSLLDDDKYVEKYNNLYMNIYTGEDAQNIYNEAVFAELWAEYNPENPEETIEIVPNMKWFVRSKEKQDGVYIILANTNPMFVDDFYGIAEDDEEIAFKAPRFDTKEEAEKWTNPLTEAVQLPVEGE